MNMIKTMYEMQRDIFRGVPYSATAGRCLRDLQQKVAKSGSVVCPNGTRITPCNTGVLSAGFSEPCNRWGTRQECKACNMARLYKFRKSVRKAWDSNKAIPKEKVLEDITWFVREYKPVFFRMFYAGDFYRLSPQDFLSLARDNPQTIFYGYSKIRGVAAGFLPYAMPNNFVLWPWDPCDNPLGTTENYADLETLSLILSEDESYRKQYWICPKTLPSNADGHVMCGINCCRCMTQGIWQKQCQCGPLFVQH